MVAARATLTPRSPLVTIPQWQRDRDVRWKIALGRRRYHPGTVFPSCNDAHGTATRNAPAALRGAVMRLFYTRIRRTAKSSNASLAPVSLEGLRLGQALACVTEVRVGVSLVKDGMVPRPNRERWGALVEYCAFQRDLTTKATAGAVVETRIAPATPRLPLVALLSPYERGGW